RLLFEAIRDGRCKSFAELRRTVQALLDAAAETLPMFAEVSGGTARAAGAIAALPDPAPAGAFTAAPVAVPAAHDRAPVTAFEAKVEAVQRLLREGFDGNEAIVLRRVSRANAEVTAERLRLLGDAIKKMELALRAAIVVDMAQHPAEPASVSAPIAA